jgi:putative oxidoreductase
METTQILTSWTPDAFTVSAGLLVVRLVLGLTLAAHGAQKLFGWFGGYGIAGTGGFFEQIGFRPGSLFAWAAGLSELGGGLLVALGLLGPVGPALIVSVMIVATASVHWRNGFFMATNGIEFTLVIAAAAVALGLAGPGVFSLDALLGLGSLWAPRVAWPALALGIAGAVVNLATRRPAPSESAVAQ